MKKTSNIELRNLIAEEFSWMIGQLTGVRPAGEDNSPAAYYSAMPPEMRVIVDQCVDRIAVRLTGQRPSTLEKLS